MEKEQIEARLKKLNEDFINISKQLDDVYKQYSEKLVEIQNEGNQKLTELREKREQIRGAYTEWFNVLKDNYNQEPKPLDIQEPKEETKIENDKNKQETETHMSAEEYEKVKEAISSVTNAETTDLKKVIESKPTPTQDVRVDESTAKITTVPNNQDDVPDYLKDEFKK